MQLRSQATIRNNWFRTKLEVISNLDSKSFQELLAVGGRDDANFQKLNKTATAAYIKETPFIKNNNRQVSATSTDDSSGMTAKQKMIADLKKKLLAPTQAFGPKGKKPSENTGGT